MDYYINKQAAIDVADAVWCVTGDKNVAKVWDQLRDLQSVDVPHGIPCSERLPEDHKPKLLTHEVYYITGKVIKDVQIAYYDDETNDWLSDEESPEIICYPLAWMPLPEPYVKGEEDE